MQANNNLLFSQMKKLLQSGAVLPSGLVADRLKLAKNLENLNNFIKITTDVAQEQAKQSDSRYQQAFGPVKNIWGSKYMKVKTDSDECETPKHNKNDFYVSGGSSGGCAVSVASGITFISVASDSGGSVRMPASYCGIVGLKPSYGRLSRYGLIPLVNSLDCPGILARKVDDARIAFNILAGFDPLDPTSSKDIFIPVRDEIIDIKKFKVGVPQEYHCDRLSREVVEVWGIVADLLETAGAKVVKVRRLIARDYLRVWESGVDALITPITLTEAPTYSWYMSKESWEHSVAQDFCCPSVNLAGLPAISIPIKLSRKGLPLSLQIITPIYREDVLLAIARWIENVVDFPKLEVQINDDNDDDEECKEEI
ncbi:hypothetical protein C0J52_21994 [Blattella germanica]|nr:hypothetical protein C0J52_21994 [Blattella germanica]